MNAFMAAEPLIRWSWIGDHLDRIRAQVLQHIELTVLAVVIGCAIAFPLSLLAYRRRWTYGPITWLGALLYTIPSLALFVLLIPWTGLSVTTVEIGLVSYTLLILVRNTVAGLEGVPEDVKDAARGMGLSRRQMLWRVEVPLAMPVIIAGIRIATISTIGLVTIGSLIGKGGVGLFINDGLNQLFQTEILLGAVLAVILALLADALLWGLERLLTPWARRATARSEVHA